MGWAVPGIFAAICVLAWPRLGVKLHPNAVWMIPIFMGLYACHLAPQLVRYRLRDDRTWAALELNRLAEIVGLFTKVAIPVTLCSLSIAVYSYLAIRLRWPLRDARPGGA